MEIDWDELDDISTEFAQRKYSNRVPEIIDEISRSDSVDKTISLIRVLGLLEEAAESSTSLLKSFLDLRYYPPLRLTAASALARITGDYALAINTITEVLHAKVLERYSPPEANGYQRLAVYHLYNMRERSAPATADLMVAARDYEDSIRWAAIWTLAAR